jgi:hypothetical protein
MFMLPELVDAVCAKSERTITNSLPSISVVIIHLLLLAIMLQQCLGIPLNFESCDQIAINSLL